MAERSKGIVVPISATDNSARAFESVNAKVSELKQTVAGLQAQLRGGNPGEALGAGMHGAVPEVAAASAAVRAFEGTLSVRAVERFLTSTLSLGPILTAAFPVVGALAFGSVVLEGAEKLYKMAEAARNLSTVIKQAFDEAISKERQHADELDLANAKMDEAIAKFEHKPANGLATAAADAKVEFDKLDTSIRTAVTDAKALFDEKYKVGFFASHLGGTASTDPVKDEVVGTLGRVDQIRDTYSGVIRQAQDGGESTQHIDDLKQTMLAKIQEEFAKSRTNLQRGIVGAENKQEDSRRLGGNGNQYDSFINASRGSLALYDQQERSFGEQYRSGVLAPKVAQAKSDKENGDSARKAEAEARRAEAERRAKAEADEKAAAAARTLADANARALAARQKAGTDTELDQLESAHRAALVSDEEYYRQREAIQTRALADRRATLDSERNSLSGQIGTATRAGAQLTGNDKANNDARIVELRAKIVDLDSKDAELTGEAAKNARVRLDAETDLAKKRLATADSLAAQLEGERGGSVVARQRQSRDQFNERRDGLKGADPTLLADLDTQQGIDQDSIAARGAEQNAGAGDVQLRVRRRTIDDQAARGEISSQDAQRQKIALNREEAASLEPVLAAYQKLAADGDLAAVGKVAELQQQITELNDPVNEVAANIRSQFDSAMEGFFENIGRGRSALKSLGDAIQKDLSKDAYQQLIRPGIQAAEGILVPNKRDDSGPSGIKGFGDAFKGITSKVPGLSGLLGSKGGGGNVKVEIVNQGGDRVQDGEASMQGFESEFEDKVIHIVLKSASSGGPIGALFKG